MHLLTRPLGWLAVLMLTALVVFVATCGFGLSQVTERIGASERIGSERPRICDKVAERKENPRHFVSSLHAGQTGCLRAGVYRSRSRPIVFLKPGVTLTSYPRQRATIVGRIVIDPSAEGATVRNLSLNGRDFTRHLSPLIYADGAVLRDNEITNHHSEICVHVTAYPGSGPPTRRRDRGQPHPRLRQPAGHQQDHGIYIGEARDTVIRDNWIYDNADRGIQLYPDADGTLVTGNVIDGNGQGVAIGGSGSQTSDNNLVEHNVITNSTIRYNVEGSWGSSVGTGNVVRQNCTIGGARGRRHRRHPDPRGRLRRERQHRRRPRVHGRPPGRLPIRLRVALRRRYGRRPPLAPAPPKPLSLDACPTRTGRLYEGDAPLLSLPCRSTDPAKGWARSGHTNDSRTASAAFDRRGRLAIARRRVGLFAASLVVAGLAASAVAGSASAAVAGCDRVAATNGSDAAPGTTAAPFATPQKLIGSLAPGQTGCLRAGVYVWSGDLSIRTPGVRVASFPGERATLQGRLRIEATADGAVVEDLTLDGRNSNNYLSPLVYADGAVLRDNEITNHHTSICVHITAYPGSGPPTRRRDRGQPHPRLRPPAGHQHGPRHLRRRGPRHRDPRQLDLRQRRPRASSSIPTPTAPW